MNRSHGPLVAQHSITPDGGELLRASVSGAAIAGSWAAIYEAIRVRNNEITAEEAVRITVGSAAVGAGAGAVAQIASHVARSIPLLGLAALAAGVVYFASTSPGSAPASVKDDIS